MALTVEEHADGQFFWVILEGSNGDRADAGHGDGDGEAIHYTPLHIAATPQSTYASALVLGAHAMRRIADPSAASLAPLPSSGTQGPPAP
jgi:hypothetical protein